MVSLVNSKFLLAHPDTLRMEVPSSLSSDICLKSTIRKPLLSLSWKYLNLGAAPTNSTFVLPDTIGCGCSPASPALARITPEASQWANVEMPQIARNKIVPKVFIVLSANSSWLQSTYQCSCILSVCRFVSFSLPISTLIQCGNCWLDLLTRYTVSRLFYFYCTSLQHQVGKSQEHGAFCLSGVDWPQLKTELNGTWEDSTSSHWLIMHWRGNNSDSLIPDLNYATEHRKDCCRAMLRKHRCYGPVTMVETVVNELARLPPSPVPLVPTLGSYIREHTVVAHNGIFN